MTTTYQVIQTLNLPKKEWYNHLPQNRQEELECIWKNLVFEKMMYDSDGRKIIGYIVRPKQTKQTKDYPVIIYNRGGTKEYGKIDDKQLFYIMSTMASWGYVIIGSQYSGNDGSEGKDECGGMDVSDVVNLLPVVDELPNIDKTRIGMFGGSRGGMQSILALPKMRRVKACVITSSPSNQLRVYKNSPDLQEFRRDCYDVYSEEENTKRSAAFQVDKLTNKIPFLLLHGEQDKSVSVLDVLELAEKFVIHEIPFKLIVYEGDDHLLSRHRRESQEEIKAWFDQHI